MYISSDIGPRPCVCVCTAECPDAYPGHILLGAEVKPAFCLSRNSITMLLQMLPREKSNGWSHELEVLVTLYWLACAAS